MELLSLTCLLLHLAVGINDFGKPHDRYSRYGDEANKLVDRPRRKGYELPEDDP